MIGVAVVGAGRWGRNLISALERTEGCEVRMIVDPEPGLVIRLSAGHRGVSAFPGLQRAMSSLAWEDVDTVVIATPASTHFYLASEALRAGKHVLVEKPLTTNVFQASALVRLAAVNELVLAVGHTFLYHGACVLAEELLRDSALKLGAVKTVSSRRLNDGPVREDVSALWDLAAHDVALFERWLGERPVYVSATRTDDGSTALLSLRYPSGALGTVHVSWDFPRKVREIDVVTERGSLRFDDLVRWPLMMSLEGEHSPRHLLSSVSVKEPLLVECADFVRCCETGERPVSDGETGLEVVRVLEAADRSGRAFGSSVDVSR